MNMSGSEQLAVHFPESAEVPESTRHLRLRTLLFQFLEHAFAAVAVVGSEQFVYWDPSNPRACLAPDAFVRFGCPNHDFGSWKVWEGGAPHVAVEIISDADAGDSSWEEKLEKYRQLGVSELVRFDPEEPSHPLRIWDFVGDNLLERRLLATGARSQHLGGFWLPVEEPSGGLSLRLSRDEHGLQLFPTLAEHNAHRLGVEAEARRSEAEARRSEAEARRSAEEALRSEAAARRAAERRIVEAEQRIVELEAELERRA